MSATSVAMAAGWRLAGGSAKNSKEGWEAAKSAFSFAKEELRSGMEKK